MTRQIEYVEDGHHVRVETIKTPIGFDGSYVIDGTDRFECAGLLFAEENKALAETKFFVILRLGTPATQA